MKTLPLSEAKSKLNELVEEVVSTHERITITRHGRPAVVVLSVDDLEAMEETLFWEAQENILEDIRLGRDESEKGNTNSEAEIRKQFGIGRSH